MKSLRITAWLIGTGLASLPVAAQPTGSQASPSADQSATSPVLKSLTEALKLRSDMATAVAAGTEKAQDAVVRLKAEASPTGLKITPDADFAFGALDIGRRLIALHKPAEAEVFFKESASSLDAVIARTADTAAREKVQYLQARSILRTNYLGKTADGRADLDAALQLAPDDKHLQQLRRLIPSDPEITLQKQKEAPSRG